MYTHNGIVYPGEPAPLLKVTGVRPLADNVLWVRFNTGEAKTYDFAPMLDTPAYSPLKNPDTFKAVYIDYGVPVWCDGDIDISPEYLYQHGIDA